MNQLKQYLQDNKLYIEILGIFAAITALFLNIETDSNAKAVNFLEMLKFNFLIIFSLLLAGMVVSLFLKLSFMQGENMDKKNTIQTNIFYLFSTSTILLSFFILYNLWGYIYTLYKSNLAVILSLSVPILSVICLNLWFLVLDKFSSFIKDRDFFGGKVGRFGYLLVSWQFFYGLLNLIINSISLSKFSLYSFIVPTVLFATLSTILFFKHRKKQV